MLFVGVVAVIDMVDLSLCVTPRGRNVLADHQVHERPQTKAYTVIDGQI